MPSISDFISSFSSDIGRPNRFTVQILGTPKYNDIEPPSYLMCETAELPGITYATTEQKFGSNPIEKFPYQVQFNDINLTFIVQEKMRVKKFFDGWMEKISPPEGYNFNYKQNGTGSNSEYAGYSGQIKITQYSSSDVATYQVTLNDAYPISVNQLDLDWSSEGYHKLTVVFAYTYWERNDETLDGVLPKPTKLVNPAIVPYRLTDLGPGGVYVPNSRTELRSGTNFFQTFTNNPNPGSGVNE